MKMNKHKKILRDRRFRAMIKSRKQLEKDRTWEILKAKKHINLTVDVLDLDVNSMYPEMFQSLGRALRYPSSKTVTLKKLVDVDKT